MKFNLLALIASIAMGGDASDQSILQQMAEGSNGLLTFDQSTGLVVTGTNTITIPLQAEIVLRPLRDPGPPQDPELVREEVNGSIGQIADMDSALEFDVSTGELSYNGNFVFRLMEGDISYLSGSNQVGKVEFLDEITQFLADNIGPDWEAVDTEKGKALQYKGGEIIYVGDVIAEGTNESLEDLEQSMEDVDATASATDTNVRVSFTRMGASITGSAAAATGDESTGTGIRGLLSSITNIGTKSTETSDSIRTPMATLRSTIVTEMELAAESIRTVLNLLQELSGTPGGAGVSPILNPGLTPLLADSGGLGRAGQAYLIGRGAQPELFVPNQDGHFYPQGQYGAQITLNVHPQINPQAGTVDSQVDIFARSILEELDRL